MELLERVSELAVLQDALHALTRDGEGRVVVVSGEAGIGKSALVGQFVEGLGGGVRCWLGCCDDLFVARPLGPVLDIARQAGGRLRELCEAGDPAAVFEGFLDELTRRDRLTVFVLEDLQWADMATLDLVRLVGRRVRDLGALVILTHRDDIGRDHPLRRVVGGLAGGRMSRVRLGPLSEVSVRGLVGDRPIDPVRLLAATGGNPFFIAEILAHNGGLLPESVREAVLARVAGLSPGARRVLEAASVLGARVDRGVLGRMVGDVGDVDEVADAQLLVAVDGEWSFRHDLVRQSVEESLPPELCRQLHAAALRELGETAELARRAHHAIGALDGEAVRAVVPRAAEAATELGAYREAAALYRHVIGLRDGLDTRERMRLLDQCAAAEIRADQPVAAVGTLQELVSALESGDDPAAVVGALGDLARAYRYAGQGDLGFAAARRAVEVARGCGTAVMAAARSRLCHQLVVSGDLADAIAVGEQALVDARSVGEEAVCIAVSNNVGSARVLTGDDSGWDLLHAGLAQAERAGSGHEIARAHHNLMGVAVDTYRLEDAARYFERGAHAVQRLDLSLHWCMQGTRAVLLLRQSRWSEARQQALLLLRESDLSDVQRVPALVVLALIRARLGDPDPSEPLDEAAAIAAPFGEVQLFHPIAAARAEIAWLAGGHAGLERAARELHRASATIMQPWYRGEAALWCARAHLDPAPLNELPLPYGLQLSGRMADAAAAWTAIGAPYEAADALADSSDPDDLRTAHTILQALGARPRSAMVARSLRQLGVGGVPRGPRPGTRAHAAALTEREHEVLTLVATGLSNADIAAVLIVSTKTIDHHVSAVLRKLGTHDRRSAVQRAHELGIVPET